MDMIRDVPIRQASMPNTDLTSVALTRLLLLRDAKAALGQLAKRGVDLALSDEGWQPVAGGQEYQRASVERVTVDGLVCRLIVEVSRTTASTGPHWLNAFELHPADGDGAVWLEAMRGRLAADFELESAGENGAEVYRRGSLEHALLLPDPPRLFLYLGPPLPR